VVRVVPREEVRPGAEKGSCPALSFAAPRLEISELLDPHASLGSKPAAKPPLSAAEERRKALRRSTARNVEQSRREMAPIIDSCKFCKITCSDLRFGSILKLRLLRSLFLANLARQLARSSVSCKFCKTTCFDLRFLQNLQSLVAPISVLDQIDPFLANFAT
jgi:hypothetical protein